MAVPSVMEESPSSLMGKLPWIPARVLVKEATGMVLMKVTSGITAMV